VWISSMCLELQNLLCTLLCIDGISQSVVNRDYEKGSTARHMNLSPLASKIEASNLAIHFTVVPSSVHFRMLHVV
jgi:hypothetical protein